MSLRKFCCSMRLAGSHVTGTGNRHPVLSSSRVARPAFSSSGVVLSRNGDPRCPAASGRPHSVVVIDHFPERPAPI
jgi:hypothetical protein